MAYYRPINDIFICLNVFSILVYTIVAISHCSYSLA